MPQVMQEGVSGTRMFLGEWLGTRQQLSPVVSEVGGNTTAEVPKSGGLGSGFEIRRS